MVKVALSMVVVSGVVEEIASENIVSRGLVSVVIPIVGGNNGVFPKLKNLHSFIDNAKIVPLQHGNRMVVITWKATIVVQKGDLGVP